MDSNNWSGYKNYDHFYWVDQFDSFIDEISKTCEGQIIYKGKKYYWNIPASFDIETSSYRKMGEKKATMYLWSLNINGSTIVGRKWAEFSDVLNKISRQMHTLSCNLVIYVHNLAYEFQWMRKWLNFTDVFAVKKRRPIYAKTGMGIEFRCSYILSNYALAYIGEKLLHKYPVQKDVGAIDYQLERNWLTHLTDTEIWYNVHDNQVVTSFIQEKIENEGGITAIPLTNTGYVRNFSRQFCFTYGAITDKERRKAKAKYHEITDSLIITSECEYDQLDDAFAGGFTHSNPFRACKVWEYVFSMDLASSYPAVMVMKKFPMGRGTLIGEATEKMVDLFVKDGWCCLFTIKLHGVQSDFLYDNYISSSKCSVLSKDAVINNGRVNQANELQMVVTEQDWDIIRRTYTWKGEPEIHNLRVYPAGYLPKPFIMAILELFGKKTSLKDVEGREIEYMVSKNMINSTYGMAVTAIIRKIYEYSSGNWSTQLGDKFDQLESYNNNYNRFLFYAWGIWVTAHARHNLWDAIIECGEDYIYSDTDSLKGLNYDKHKEWFANYNFNIVQQLKEMCTFYNIPISSCMPFTPEGEMKIIGIWEREKDYRRFKTIGAKRYMFEYMNGELWFTISGVNKKLGVPFLLNEFAGVDLDMAKLAYNPRFDQKKESKEAMKNILDDYHNGLTNWNQIFENFNDGLYFPKEFTGKQTLTYIDEPIIDKMTDYQGNTAVIFEQSCINMEPQGYWMFKSDEYIRFLEGIEDASI